jgi:hypothetical protein
MPDTYDAFLASKNRVREFESCPFDDGIGPTGCRRCSRR